jgi:hypothetical protein
MDFRTATDQLIQRMTLVDIAEACDSAVNSIERARLDADSRHHREPPPEWEAAVARLARERGQELLRLAEQLMKR